jgi:hypothetical protein
MTFVARPRNQDLAARFALARTRSFTVPSDIDIPAVVGCYRSSTIQSKGLLHEISLRFKRGAPIVEASVKHWRAPLSGFGVDRSSGFRRI